jgi:hypothetical protein
MAAPEDLGVSFEQRGGVPKWEWDTIWSLHGRFEGNREGIISAKATEEGRVIAVAEAKAAAEAGVGDEAAPSLADEGGAREGGGLQWKAEEDLGEQVVDF